MTGRKELIRTLKYYAWGIVKNFVITAKEPCWKDKNPGDLGNWLQPGNITDQLVDDAFTAEVIKSGTIKIIPKHNNGFILFENLQPKKTISSKFETPVTSNEQISTVSTSKLRNETGGDVSRTLTFTEESTTSTSQDVGASLTIAISQSIQAGGDLYGFVSTTEINASASASFSKQWGSGTSKSEQRQINITTVPNSISNVAFTKKTGDFTQKATFFCSFDASVTINAGPGHAEIKCDTIEDLRTIMQGFGNPAGT